jgi:hypothetical protein
MGDNRPLTAVLLENPEGVCADCIVLKAGIRPGEVRTMFERLADVIRVAARGGRCPLCTKQTKIFALTRSAFILGDLVGSAVRPDWVGEVIDTSRLRRGRVTVRWRTPSGTSLQSVDEPADVLFLLPPLRGGAASAISPEAILGLHRAAMMARTTSVGLRHRSRELRTWARRLCEKSSILRTLRKPHVRPAA